MNSKRIVTAAMAVMFGASVIMTGCGSINKDATLVTINDGAAKISLGYGNFSARYQQAMYDQYFLGYYGEGMWSSDMSGEGKTFQEDVKEDILDDMESEYLCVAHASEYGVSLSDEDNKAIAEAASKFMSDNDKATIEALGATEDIVKEYLVNRTISSRVQRAVKEAADVTVTEDECWQRTVSYVFFNTNNKTDEDGNTVEMTADEKAVLSLSASDLADAEDFDAKAEELGLDVSTYSYTKGETEDSRFDMAVIEAAEALTTEGQVSGVVEVADRGYYVIRLDSDHDAEASEAKKEALISSKQSEAYTAVVDGWKAETTWTVDEKAWSQVKFESLFSTKQVEEAEETEAAE